ncbi:FIST signal transduction protein [Butyrivibrio sp. VCD2006]|uniref:FIST signal transduction protein n=1 Tax=Butyrivibrio sp. VCD2006 TaxID=1280664 RepID=UPI0003FA3933|nr:FIST N-terminal domain-containing protein [Butyrivibrio sp. VCD2006]
MKMFNGKSSSGSVADATRGLSSPKLIIFTGEANKFDSIVAEIEAKYPGVPSIGCVGMGYDSAIQETGITITAFTEGVKVKTGVLESVSKMPARHIQRLEKDIEEVRPGKENTAIIDFCAGNDAAVLTTLRELIEKFNLQVMGATGDAGKVSVDGKVYEDAMTYAVVKNEGGRVKTYKENIYAPKDNRQLIASKTDKAKYYLGELNGRSAKQVYMDLTGTSTDKDIINQTFQNPLGKMIGNDVCICSIKDVSGSGLIMYRQINDSDILTLLEMKDPMEVAQNTVDRIKSDFTKISGIYSVNCIFRYLVLKERGELNTYLNKIASLGPSCGLIGFGEHYNTQFVNQTMTCVVFE